MRTTLTYNTASHETRLAAPDTTRPQHFVHRKLQAALRKLDPSLKSSLSPTHYGALMDQKPALYAKIAN